VEVENVPEDGDLIRIAGIDVDQSVPVPEARALAISSRDRFCLAFPPEASL